MTSNLPKTIHVRFDRAALPPNRPDNGCRAYCDGPLRELTIGEGESRETFEGAFMTAFEDHVNLGEMQ